MTTKADQVAAERLLKAAVKRAREVLAGPEELRYRQATMTYTGTQGTYYGASSTATLVGDWVRPGAEDVVAMLRAAGESAALLLGEAS